MNNKLSRSLWISFVAIPLFVGCNRQPSDTPQQTQWLIVPYPQKILNRGGVTPFNKEFWVIADLSNSSTSKMANYLVDELSNLTGQSILITDLYSTRKHKQSISIALASDSSNVDGYSLDLTSSQIKITASSEQGLFYGIQTLLQVLHDYQDSNQGYQVPISIIKDWPKHTVRGILITRQQMDSLDNWTIKTLAKFKFNNIFCPISNTVSDTLIENALANYLDIRSLESINYEEYQIIKVEPMATFEEVYLTNFGDGNREGLVIDLRELSLKQIMILIPAYAEHTWTDQSNKDLDRINRWLSQK